MKLRINVKVPYHTFPGFLNLSKYILRVKKNKNNRGRRPGKI